MLHLEALGVGGEGLSLLFHPAQRVDPLHERQDGVPADERLPALGQPRLAVGSAVQRPAFGGELGLRHLDGQLLAVIVLAHGDELVTDAVHKVV